MKIKRFISDIWLYRNDFKRSRYYLSCITSDNIYRCILFEPSNEDLTELDCYISTNTYLSHKTLDLYINDAIDQLGDKWFSIRAANYKLDRNRLVNWLYNIDIVNMTQNWHKLGIIDTKEFKFNHK